MDFSETAPLNRDAAGTIRVTGTRVTLDTLVAAFKKGNTAEEIQDSFPSVSLAQTYSVIAWYLNHQAEVEQYLLDQAADANNLRHEIESKPEHAAFRKKLQERREQLIKT